MKTIKIILPVLLICLWSCKPANVLTSDEKTDGWTLLFDGKSMDQWRSWLSDTVSGWAIEEGCMKALGLGGDIGGDIITRKQYDDFELSLEWKIAPQGNSGILYMVVEDSSYHAVYETGPEFQLLDDEGWPGELEDWQLTGANYAMHVAENVILNPIGKWNTARIVKRNVHVEHWLNGRKVVAYELWNDDWKARVEAGKWKDFPDYGRSSKGHIALQDHGSQAWFRNIKIREL